MTVEDDIFKALQILPEYTPSFERRPDGNLLLILESPDHAQFKRVVPKNLTDAEKFVNRIKLDLMIERGEAPKKDILRAVSSDSIPTYTTGELFKTRSASLWERRKILKKTNLPN